MGVSQVGPQRSDTEIPRDGYITWPLGPSMPVERFELAYHLVDASAAGAPSIDLGVNSSKATIWWDCVPPYVDNPSCPA